jgi:hypothetical protein
MMLNDVEIDPSPVTVTSPVAEIPLQLTGTDWLIGAGKSTVGWLLSLLHSRTAPVAPFVNPEPVTATLVPPLRHVPGFAVRLGEPPDVFDSALHGAVVVVLAVVVVVVAAVVVVVVPPPVVVVVVPPPVVVVVVPPPPPLEKLMLDVALSPP